MSPGFQYSIPLRQIFCIKKKLFGKDTLKKKH